MPSHFSLHEKLVMCLLFKHTSFMYPSTDAETREPRHISWTYAHAANIIIIIIMQLATCTKSISNRVVSLNFNIEPLNTLSYADSPEVWLASLVKLTGTANQYVVPLFQTCLCFARLFYNNKRPCLNHQRAVVGPYPHDTGPPSAQQQSAVCRLVTKLDGGDGRLRLKIEGSLTAALPDVLVRSTETLNCDGMRVDPTSCSYLRVHEMTNLKKHMLNDPFPVKEPSAAWTPANHTAQHRPIKLSTIIKYDAYGMLEYLRWQDGLGYWTYDEMESKMYQAYTFLMQMYGGKAHHNSY